MLGFGRLVGFDECGLGEGQRKLSARSCATRPAREEAINAVIFVGKYLYLYLSCAHQGSSTWHPSND